MNVYICQSSTPHECARSIRKYIIAQLDSGYFCNPVFELPIKILEVLPKGFIHINAIDVFAAKVTQIARADVIVFSANYQQDPDCLLIEELAKVYKIMCFYMLDDGYGKH